MDRLYIPISITATATPFVGEYIAPMVVAIFTAIVILFITQPNTFIAYKHQVSAAWGDLHEEFRTLPISPYRIFFIHWKTYIAFLSAILLPFRDEVRKGPNDVLPRIEPPQDKPDEAQNKEEKVQNNKSEDDPNNQD